MSGQGASEKIREFCNVEKFSIAFFYELERRGLGPLMLDVPGTRFRRVVESHESWRARMAALAKTEDAKLETERRRAQAAIAGKDAAASPRHVSKQRKSAERAPAAANRLLRGK
jgi:hypothetical protein